MDENSFERLTERQKACLRLVLTGRSSKHIADVLRISPGTVDQHLKAACKILGQNERGAAARLFAAWDERHPQVLDSQSNGLVEPAPGRPTVSITGREGEDRRSTPTMEVRESRATYDSGHPIRQRPLLLLLFPEIGRPRNELTIRMRLALFAIEVAILAMSTAVLFGVALAAARFLIKLGSSGG
jgi:DNA-binding CsgD family transcriptional regulator